MLVEPSTIRSPLCLARSSFWTVGFAGAVRLRQPEILRWDTQLRSGSAAEFERHGMPAVLDLAEVLLRHAKPPRDVRLALTGHRSPGAENHSDFMDGSSGAGMVKRLEVARCGLLVAAASRAEVVPVVSAELAAADSALARDGGYPGRHGLGFLLSAAGLA